MFSSIAHLNSVSILSPDNAWIKNNETDAIAYNETRNFPSDWTKAILRASIVGSVKFAQPMSGVEMVANLQKIYDFHSDAARDARLNGAKSDNSRFFTQDETKEDWA